jgi:hypothetical protein
VVEFTPAQEEAIQKALNKGESVPAGQPATLYEALVKDYRPYPGGAVADADYHPSE